MAELEDVKLGEVSGGYNPVAAMQPFVPYNCQVTNVYWGTTFMADGPYNAVVGHYMQVVYNPGAQGPCKYQLISNGQYMGWTIAGNFRLV